MCTLVSPGYAYISSCCWLWLVVVDIEAVIRVNIHDIYLITNPNLVFRSISFLYYAYANTIPNFYSIQIYSISKHRKSKGQSAKTAYHSNITIWTTTVPFQQAGNQRQTGLWCLGSCQKPLLSYHILFSLLYQCSPSPSCIHCVGGAFLHRQWHLVPLFFLSSLPLYLSTPLYLYPIISTRLVLSHGIHSKMSKLHNLRQFLKRRLTIVYPKRSGEVP